VRIPVPAVAPTLPPVVHRIVLDCELAAPHPGQPHLHHLQPVEAGDAVFVGWWHEGE
jgi:hypothetical protein